MLILLISVYLQHSFLQMELRYNEVERARRIYERYMQCIPSVKAWVRYAKFEMQNGEIGLARKCYERAVEELGEDGETVSSYKGFHYRSFDILSSQINISLAHWLKSWVLTSPSCCVVFCSNGKAAISKLSDRQLTWIHHRNHIHSWSCQLENFRWVHSVDRANGPSRSSPTMLARRTPHQLFEALGENTNIPASIVCWVCR